MREKDVGLIVGHNHKTRKRVEDATRFASL